MHNYEQSKVRETESNSNVSTIIIIEITMTGIAVTAIILKAIISNIGYQLSNLH